MQTLWLHIGMQKTGTSAAQTWMARNEARLLHEGLLYVRPRKGLPASGALAATLNRDPPEAARLISQLMQSVQKAGPALTDILVSSEDFSVSPPQIAAPLLDAFENCRICILVWLRRQDLFAEALTKQWIKWNGNQARDPGSMMQRNIAPLLDYDRMLEAWAAAFPRATILPQIYAEQLPGQPPPDSIAALLRAMGRDHLIPPDSQTHRANVSPQAALLHLYRTLDDPLRVRQANRRLMAGHADRFAGRGDLFTPVERQAILDRHAASNARLRARWFPDRAQLFDPRDPEAGDAPGAQAVAAFRDIYDAG